MTKVWTKAKIVDLLNRQDQTGTKAVERALVAIYAHQTLDEQSAMTTSHQNGVGFAGCDANTGSWLVKVVIAEGTEKGRPEGCRLRGKALAMGRRIALRYAGTQLLSIANANASISANG